MKLTTDVATLRAIYDSAAVVKGFEIDLGEAQIVIAVDDGEGGVRPDASLWRATRTEYLRRALKVLIDGNKSTVLNAMKTEVKADLDLIKSSADVPA